MVSHKTGLELELDSELSVFCLHYTAYSKAFLGSFLLEQSRITPLWTAI